MDTVFHFSGFAPDEATRVDANRALDRLLELAPYGARATALIQARDDGRFRCAVELVSRAGPFRAEASGATPLEALEHLEGALAQQLVRWRARRFSSPRAEGRRLWAETGST